MDILDEIISEFITIENIEKTSLSLGLDFSQKSHVSAHHETKICVIGMEYVEHPHQIFYVPILVGNTHTC